MHNGYMLDTAFGIADRQSNHSKLSLLWNRAIRANRIPFLLYKENETRFCDDVFSTHKPYIDGCWINERYFEHINAEVRSSFVFKNIDSLNLSIADQIQACNSVSLHIRRGDYLNNSIYNVCDEDYYRKAVAYILREVEKPKYFIFSDDTTWCKVFMNRMSGIGEHPIDYTIINHNKGKDSYKDMYLMTQCNHNIIANSTFSWWGAWLGTQNDKIVVCPNRWINGREFNPCIEEWYHIYK